MTTPTQILERQRRLRLLKIALEVKTELSQGYVVNSNGQMEKR